MIMTPQDTVQPLVLTALFDTATQKWLETLRQAHFPPERNLVPAHLTLFHALPGRESSAIQSELEDECAARGRCAAALMSWRFTGRGVSRDVASPGLVELRSRLAERWKGWLTLQDRKPWRPHVTIQNKVPPEQARTLYSQLSVASAAADATVSGLALWRYLSGPWERLRTFPFDDRTPLASTTGAAVKRPRIIPGQATGAAGGD